MKPWVFGFFAVFSNHVLVDAELLRSSSNQRLLKKTEEDPSGGHGTPDNLPPAMESVCDFYSGKAKGICNAYCEAQDCEVATGDDKQSCDELRRKFQEETGETRLPCDKSRCPCWDSYVDVFSEDEPIGYNWFHDSGTETFGKDDESYRVGTYGPTKEMIAEAGRTCQNSPFKCWYGCLVRNHETSDYRRFLFDDAEVYYHCVYDVVTLARDAAELIDGSLEQSVCEPLEVTDPSIECPCWDGHDILYPPMVSVGEEGTSYRYESLHANPNPHATLGLNSRYYSVFSGRYCQQKVEDVLGTISALTPDQYNTCFNDILMASKDYGENKCHWYT